MKGNWQSGQSLLVIVLLISVVFTLIASASYRLTTETQSAKVQEETVRTLAAADSGVEKGLQMLRSNSAGTYPFTHASVNLSLDGIDSSKSSIVIDATATDTFFNTQINLNEQYTFYLYQYPTGTTYYTNNMDIYFGSSSGACGAGRSHPALEFTLIYGTNQINRWLSEPCGSNPRIQGAANLLTANAGSPTFNRGGSLYRYRVDFDGILSTHAQPKLLIVRVLYAQTNVRFESSSGNFPVQGQNITSTAVSNTGVSKIVSLFRSYPQIPADFFVTQF